MLLVTIVGLTSTTATFAKSSDLDIGTVVAKIELTAEEKAFAEGLAMVLAEEKVRVEAEELRIKQELQAEKQRRVDAAFNAGVAAARAQLKAIADAKTEAMEVAKAKAIAEAEAQRLAEIQARANSFISFKNEFMTELAGENKARSEKLQTLFASEFSKQIEDMKKGFDASISVKDIEIKSIRSDVSKIEIDRDAVTAILVEANATISNMILEATQIKTVNDSTVANLQAEVASISKEATEVIAKVQAEARKVIKQEATKLNEKFAQLEIDAFNRGVTAAQDAQAKSAEQVAVDTEAKAAEIRAKIALIEKNKQTELDIKNARVAEIQARLNVLSSI